eukprot:2635645-Pyramimonas_sp.AAC.1
MVNKDFFTVQFHRIYTVFTPYLYRTHAAITVFFNRIFAVRVSYLPYFPPYWPPLIPSWPHLDPEEGAQVVHRLAHVIQLLRPHPLLNVPVLHITLPPVQHLGLVHGDVADAPLTVKVRRRLRQPRQQLLRQWNSGTVSGTVAH